MQVSPVLKYALACGEPCVPLLIMKNAVAAGGYAALIALTVQLM